MNDNLRARLLTAFIQEAGERLEKVNRLLVKIEKVGDSPERDALVAEVYREVHSLKGAAHAASLARPAALAHDLETVFGHLRSGQRVPDRALFDRVYRVVDELREAVALAPGADAGRPEPDDLAEREGDGPGRAPVAANSGGTGSVRIATEKLDALIVEGEELLATRLRAQERVMEARDLAAAMAAWETRGRSLRRKLATWHAKLESAGTTRETSPPSGEAEALLASIEQSETRATEAAPSFAKLMQGLDADTRRLAHISSRLAEELRRIRMLPVATVFDALPRTVRDLARERHKTVNLTLEGAETEADRSVLEQLGTAMIHLVRNAVDHGLESPADRQRVGKPPEATIIIRAEGQGNTVVMTVSDDGRGIDPAAVRTAAVQRGMISEEAAASLTDEETLPLVFEPGISTSAALTHVSGRGVGLDAVRRVVEQLHGSITLDSLPGEGASFTMRLPVTVATINCVVVEAAGQLFAVPADRVARVVRFSADEAERSGGRWAGLVEGSPVPLDDLAVTLGLPDEDSDASVHRRRFAVALEMGDQTVAFLIDDVLATEDVVVKPLPPPLHGTPAAAGATLLGTGRVAVILNVPELFREVAHGPRGLPSLVERPEERPPPLVLVVEDSFTTRTMEKALLEAAGFRVRTASNGLEALELVGAGGVDLVVSDVTMPVMDGFELLMRLRADDRFRTLPVVLVTGLDSAEHRRRGSEVGADAFIVKSAFDRDRLLQTIRDLV